MTIKIKYLGVKMDIEGFTRGRLTDGEDENELKKILACRIKEFKDVSDEHSLALRTVSPDFGKWEEEDLQLLVKNILNIAKPSLIIANKADLPGARENIERIKEKYPNVIATSAESELALVNAARVGLISYKSGDSSFEILEGDKLNDNQKKALEYIQTNILDVYGSTGIQKALNEAIFDLLNMIVVYPVSDEHKFTDQKGNVLPDAFLDP